MGFVSQFTCLDVQDVSVTLGFLTHRKKEEKKKRNKKRKEKRSRVRFCCKLDELYLCYSPMINRAPFKYYFMFYSLLEKFNLVHIVS